MARKVKTTTIDKTPDAISTLRMSLEGLGIYTDKEIDMQIAKVRGQLQAPARKRLNDALITAITAILDLAKYEEDTKLMAGGFLSIHVEYDKEGERTVKARAVKKGKAQRSTSNGKRPTLHVDGATYANYTDLCAHYTVPVGGDSARRRYEAKHKADPATYPEVREEAQAVATPAPATT